MNRRNLLQGFLLGASALALRPVLGQFIRNDSLAARLFALEQEHGGRLGVSILDTANGRNLRHRGGERFLLCSTFKLLAVAAVLARVDHGAERLERRIIFGKEMLLSYAPVTSQHVGRPGMSVAELCQAAIVLSDNTAANLLLSSLGGPAAVTSFLREVGDAVTRLDRTEPDLNVGHFGDLRDTTTPDAMVATLRKLLLGGLLSRKSRAQLIEWLCACRTGNQQIRAGLPQAGLRAIRPAAARTERPTMSPFFGLRTAYRS